jgi:hypothetical protein
VVAHEYKGVNRDAAFRRCVALPSVQVLTVGVVDEDGATHPPPFH